MATKIKRNTGDGIPQKGRTCGACSLCCTQLEIESKPGFTTRLDNAEDLAKPAGRMCAYLGPKGCTIYEHRPLVCRQFACDWLLGEKKFGPEDSPLETGRLGVRGVTLHFQLNPRN
ncbi:MAG: YkgJ family cysteine cluster protein [Proteobacteria bacterium]|nr:YkgJ family cysteine cluster protein [Pseudomonadota bacterium]